MEVFKVVFIAVASFAEEIGLALGLAFFCVVFFEVLLLINDFFVIAIAVPQNFKFNSRTLSTLQPACQTFGNDRFVSASVSLI
jgi:hypothetical protein